jgi:hypothetical protein
MFGWFRTVCPCDPAAKRWVEERLRWLTKQFGLHVFLERTVITPTEEFFPDPYDGSPRAVKALFHRVCDYMGVDPDDVELKLFNDTSNVGMDFFGQANYAAGLWSTGEGEEEEGGFSRPKGWHRTERGVVRIERSILDRPLVLIGTMAHELAHQRLLGEGRYKEEFDNECLTDLTAMFFGFGVFLANNPRKSTGELGYWPGTKLHKPEYLSEPMLGYALAHLAWHRDEDWPSWAKHLRWAPRSVFKQGLKFLHKTGESTFKPVRLRTGGGEKEA